MALSNSSPLFVIEDLHVSVDCAPGQGDGGSSSKEVLKGVHLTVRHGEVHAIMGRNGSGKTTLSYTLMGHPRYKVTRGRIFLQGEDITALSPEERARKRLFLAFQYPVVVPGVSVASFLRTAVRAVRGSELTAKQLREAIQNEAKALGIHDSYLSRSLNDGFSGGEKKRLETLQMQLLKPVMAVLDETDSGLDIDALRAVSERIEALRSPERGLLLITHYQRMLNYIRPDFVHVFHAGRILKSGDATLAQELEEKGYDWILDESATQQVRP